MPRNVRTRGRDPKIHFPCCTPRHTTRSKSKKPSTGDGIGWIMEKQLYTPGFSPQAWEGKSQFSPPCTTPSPKQHKGSEPSWQGQGSLLIPHGCGESRISQPPAKPLHPPGLKQGWPFPQSVPSLSRNPWLLSPTVPTAPGAAAARGGSSLGNQQLPGTNGKLKMPSTGSDVFSPHQVSLCLTFCSSLCACLCTATQHQL